MKLNTYTRRPTFPRRAALAALASMIAVPSLHAASGSWSLTTGGAWGTAANWTPSAVPGTTAGDVITIGSNITAASTITVDAARTFGTLILGDSDSTAGASFALTVGTAGAITLDQTGVATALVQFGATGGTSVIANSIAPNITLADNARFYSTLTGVQSVTGVISGAFSMTYDNDNGTSLLAPVASQGQFLVTGNNTYSGGTTIDDVRVNITTNNTALGVAGSAVAIRDGGQVYASTALATINYAFNIAGNGWAETTTGQPFGALRLEGGAIVTGSVTMSANAAIGGNGTGTVNGVVSGAFQLTKRGSGTISLGGANTYSGGTAVAGVLQLNNNTAAGTGTISLVDTRATASGGDNSLFATRVVINGGVTIANPMTLGNTTGTAGRGVLEQTGTGLGTVNGAINITGGPTAGGHFVGGAAATNALVLGGVITSSVGVTQREGFVSYRGGGTGYSALSVTNTAIVGATNGIATTAVVTLGGSGAATLDSTAFSQSLAGLIFGTAGQVHQATVNVGAQTLTLTGDITTFGTTPSHSINGTTGAVNVGAVNRTFSVSDTTATDDLTFNSVAINGSGGFTKTGTGTLALNGVNAAGPVTISAGTLATGRFTQAGTFTSQALTFGAGATTLRMKIGTGGDLITTGTLTTSGTTTLNLSQFGGILAPGTYNLINYTGTSPGLTGFSIGAAIGHATASLVDTGTAIALNVTGNDRTVWDGTTGTAWNTATTNWKLEASPVTPTNYVESDEVVFKDAPTNTTVDIATSVAPSKVNFNNTTATTYTVTGAAGIIGTTGLTKTGNGTVILRTQNAYSGATTVSDGTLELDHDATGNLVLTGTSGVSVAPAATLKLTRDDGGFTFDRNLIGSGTVEVNAHSASGGVVAQTVTLTGTNNAFTGTLRLATPVTGTYRISPPTPANLGSATVDVKSGAQVFVSAGTYSNPITLAGTGFADASGNIGALRLDGATWAGNIVIDAAGARIGSHNSTGTISGNISGGNLEVNATNFINNYTTLFTGTNTYGTTTIGGQNTAGTGTTSMRLNIGNGGTTGTLGAGNVIINGDGANGILGFDRSDGYTLAVGQTITGAGSQPTRVFIDFDTLGTGFSDNGNTITLGTTAAGGIIRVGQSRAGAIANFSGALTAGQFYAGSATRSTTNFNSGAVINVGTLNVARTGGSGSVLNIKSGSTLNVTGQFTLGEQAANNSGDVNQSGGDVTVGAHVRIAHWPTETSNYNLSGGTLTVSSITPSFPYTATGTEVNGGIYVGVDGAGFLTQTGGTLTTGYIVLDNRTDSPAGANAPNGNDAYTLSGGTVIFTNAAGLISRNNTTAAYLNGGTIKAGSGVSPNLDSNKIVVGGPVTIDTNGANTVSLYGTTGGLGSFSVTGGGTFRTQDGTGATSTQVGGLMPGGSLGSVSVSVGATSTLQSNRSVTDVWAGTISGAGTLVKQNNGLLSLTGNTSGFTGTTLVGAGRLDVPTNFGSSSISVADGASLGGESTNANVTLGAFTGSNLYIDGSTAGALTATNLTLNGTTTIDFSVAPASTAAPMTVLNYTNITGTPSFGLTNFANYRAGATVDTSVPGTVTLSLVTKPLTWTGTGGTTWNITTTSNWNDSSPAADVFYAGDYVTFDDTSANTAVTVSSGVTPFKTTVNTSTTSYTLTSIGSGIAGAGNLEKSGTSALTLVGPNTYSGQTVLNGGNVNIASATSLGNAAPSNAIVFNGGKLTPTAAMDLGSTRPIVVNAGGGTISAAGAAAYTVTISGSLRGSGTLGLTSGSTVAPTYTLSGDNSGFSGTINLDSAGATATGTTLLLTSNTALTGGTVNVAFPPTTATGIATSVTLANVSINGVTLALTSNLNGAISQRTQLATNSGTNSWGGPITVAGNDVIQLNTSNSLTINGDITGTHTGVLFVRGASPGSGVINGIINSPSSNLVKTDTGLWTINSSGNTWASTSVAVGTLRMGGTGVLPTTSSLNLGQNDANTAVLDLNGFNQTVASLTSNPTTSGANTTGKSITSATPATLTVNQASTTTYASLIAGNVTLVKDGSGSLTLGGANTMTTNTSVLGGTLKLGNAVSPLGAATTTTTVANGATIDAGGFTPTTKISLVISGTGVGGLGALQSTVGGATNQTFFNSINFTGGDLTYNSGAARYDFFASAATTINGGTRTLTKLGTSESWWSPGAGATVGNIVVNEGTFGVQSSNNLGDNSMPITINANGTVNTFGGQTNTKPVVINGGVLATNNNTNNWNGTITLTGAGTSSRIAPGAGLQLNLGGKVTGTEGFEKINASTLELQNAANDWAGDTKVTAGTLRVSAAGKLSPATSLDMNGGTVDINATSQSVAGLKGATGTITGSGSLTINQAATTVYSGAITSALTLTKLGNGSLTLSGAQSYAALNANAGTTTLTTSLPGAAISNGGGILNLNADATGSTVTANATTNFGSRQTLAALNVGAAGVAKLALHTGGPANITPMDTSALSITAGGKFDLTNNVLVVRGGTFATIRNQVASGFNGGSWNGAGINSSTATNDPLGLTALAVASNVDLGYSAFGNVTGLTGNEILVKTTYYGDNDLSGTVTTDDFSLFLDGFTGAAPASWLNGDYDYDGVVTSDDFSLFLASLTSGAPALSASGPAAGGSSAGAPAAVPEPGSIGLLFAGALGLLGRRRRTA